MKTLLTLLAVLGAQFIAAPEAEAKPHKQTHRYVTSRTSCGCPIYTQRYISYYDRCGHPVYRYRTEPIVHRCRPPHRHSNKGYHNPYHPHSKHRATTPPRCGSSHGHSRKTYQRPSIFNLFR